MSENRITMHVEKLRAEREQTLLKLTSLRTTLRSEVEAEADQGDPNLVERQKATALLRVLESKLASLDYAVREAEAGRYGICERCGEAIDPARLEAIPETTFCMKCKQATEQGTGMQGIVALA